MSNQEAIALLRNLEDSLDAYCELNEEGKTAFRIAIEALNCSEIPNSSDTISRQAAIDVLTIGEEFLKRVLDAVDVVGYERKKYEWGLDLIESYILDMRELPSAQPEPCEDAVSRQVIFDTAAEYEKQLCEILGDENELVEVVEILKHRLIALPSAQPEIKPIDYQDCANAMLRMWMDGVVTDGEYNRIMDKLNAFWRTRNDRSD